jgi:integrase
MKYVQLRNSIYYYRRRVPSALLEITSVKSINRPLSTDVKHAKILSTKYDNLFKMIDLRLKLNEDVDIYIKELKLKPVSKNIFSEYTSRLDVSEQRLEKVKKLIDVVKHFLPNDLSKIDLSHSDRMRNCIIGLPNRRLAKYKYLSIKEILSMTVPVEDRIGVGAVNEHITILNSFLKYIHQRDITAREYPIRLVKKETNDRDEKVALTSKAIIKLLEATRKPKVRTSLTLLYLTGMRPSEAYKCKVTIVDGIKCFDLTDTTIKLKTKGSYRIIPVHAYIKNPEQILEDYRSINKRIVSRGFKKVSSIGTLYSLRHSFATELASKAVEPHIISELLGHSHSGMTMGRYVKGLPVQMLKSTIDILSL